ncbi:MAG: efflux RND transporter periplasmic adaptor subunit [Marinifilaceae bacterium]
MKKIFIPLCVAVAMLATGCNKKRATKTTEKMRVETCEARVDKTGRTHEFPFVTKPFRTTNLSFRVGGPVTRFNAFSGNLYQQGEVIAQIDPRDFIIRKERSEALYIQCKTEFERICKLYNSGNIAASSYDKAKAEYTSAKLNYETACNELADTKLTAPFTGFVGEVFIEQYQDIQPTRDVVSFIDMNKLKIETYVTKEVAARKADIKSIELTFDGDNKCYIAQLLEVSKSTTSNNLSYLLTAQLDNTEAKLISGMSGKVNIIYNDEVKEEVITIPQAAVAHRPTQGSFVWVVDDEQGAVTKRKVITGSLAADNRVIILEGIEKGERIAVSGLRFLSDNMPVENISNKIDRI